MSFIGWQKSIIPACDVETFEKLGELVLATATVPGIGAYKVGLELIIKFGLGETVDMIRRQTSLPIIYDHQKGGTDIPELGPKFAKAVKSCGANAVILFPFGGAETERVWIESCKAEGLVVLVGGHMTQKNFLQSQNGFIADGAPIDIYTIAANHGVTHFVVPGNKLLAVRVYRQILVDILGEEKVTLFAPGFISQGGGITETGEVAGERWHAIVGSAIYNQDGVENMRNAAERLTTQIIKEV